MTTNDSKRICAHKENAALPAHEQELLLEAHQTPQAAAAVTDSATTDPIFTNSARGNVSGAMKWGMAIMLALALVSAIAVVIGLSHHKAQPTSAEYDYAYATPGASFITRGNQAPQFTREEFNSDFQPQSTATSATAINSDGSTRLVAVADPTTRVVYLFDLDSSVIPENETLNTLAKNASAAGNEITVIAYTDPTGRPAHNLDLSKRRAKALGDYLTAHGVDASHIKTIGKGQTDAFGSNALDRRAELHF